MFETTIRSIVGQQISVIAADAIWARLTDKIGDITRNVLALTMEEVAKCGLSGQKPITSLVWQKFRDLLGQDWDNMTELKLLSISKFRNRTLTAEMMLMFFSCVQTYSVLEILV